MISVPSETYGCCSHSTPYGSGISALSSPTVTLLTHHTNIWLESPCWDKFPPPVKIQRICGRRLLFYTSDTQFTFSSHLWHNTWACSFFLRAKKKKFHWVKTNSQTQLFGFFIWQCLIHIQIQQFCLHESKPQNSMNFI